jgi:hypothetical protein
MSYGQLTKSSYAVKKWIKKNCQRNRKAYGAALKYLYSTRCQLRITLSLFFIFCAVFEFVDERIERLLEQLVVAQNNINTDELNLDDAEADYNDWLQNDGITLSL